MFTVKKGIKETITTGIQKCLASSYWRSVSSEMSKLNSQTAVLQEYPTQATCHYPFVRTNISVKNAQWLSFSPADPNSIKAFKGTGQCILEIYSLYAPLRDLLSDSLLMLFLLRQGTLYNLLDQYFYQQANNGYPLIYPNYGNVQMGNDEDGKGLVWSPNKHVYATSLSFDFSYVQTFESQLNGDLIKAIKTNFNLKQ